MKYKLYTTSHKAWDAMFKAMTKAESSIYLEMYILSSNTSATHNFFKLLEDKARAGLEVIVIADAYGSSDLSSELIESLRQAGVEFIFFSHWLRRTHRKILIVDHKTAFLGGVNIREDIRNWRDLQIKISGAVVKFVLKSFANAYQKVGGKNQNILKFSYTPFSKKIKYWVTDNWPSTNKVRFLNNYYRQKINDVKTSLVLVTPYLLPPRWLLVVIDEACLRGVKVEIIIPGDTDIKILNKINLFNAHRLSKIGVKLYFTRTMNHAKLMLLDNGEITIGSQNIDILSFGLNFEAGISSRQAQLVNDVKVIIDKWKKEAKPFSGKLYRLNLLDRILFNIYKVFYPIF